MNRGFFRMVSALSLRAPSALSPFPVARGALKIALASKRKLVNHHLGPASAAGNRFRSALLRP